MAKAPRPKTDPQPETPAKPAAAHTSVKPARERSGWLAKFAPGVRNLASKADKADKRETPDNLWVKAGDTGEMIYRPDLEAAWWVTPAGKHMRIGPPLRFAYTFDQGVYEELPSPSAPDDPLHFVDDRAYTERLRAARKATGEQDAMAIGFGDIGSIPAVVLVQDFAFMGGSLGMAAGEGFVAAAKAAVAREAPLVVFTAAGGARMQEGALSLMQMARTTLAIQELKQARLPYIVVLTDPTTGGVTASYAMLGDVHLAEPGAMIGFAGPRVIEETIREVLPPGFQRSEYLVEKGMVDRVVPRKELPAILGSILETLMMGRARRAA
jgi:acetyl-CoA carboxylase carboxyl transferase subunit beta